MMSEDATQRNDPAGLSEDERAALVAAVDGTPPAPGDLSEPSMYEQRRDAGRGGEQETAQERQLRQQADATVSAPAPFEAERIVMNEAEKPTPIDGRERPDPAASAAFGQDGSSDVDALTQAAQAHGLAERAGDGGTAPAGGGLGAALPAEALRLRALDLASVQSGWTVYGSDGEQVGVVGTVMSGYLLVSGASPGGRDMVIPRDFIETVANSRVILNRPKVLLMDMHLDESPLPATLLERPHESGASERMPGAGSTSSLGSESPPARAQPGSGNAGYLSPQLGAEREPVGRVTDDSAGRPTSSDVRREQRNTGRPRDGKEFEVENLESRDHVITTTEPLPSGKDAGRTT